VNNFVLPRVKELGARPTDKDLQFIIDAMPNLLKSKNGNLLLIAGIRKIAQGRLNTARYMQDFLRLEGNEENYKKGYTLKDQEGINDANVNRFAMTGAWRRYMGDRLEAEPTSLDDDYRRWVKNIKDDGSLIVSSEAAISYIHQL